MLNKIKIINQILKQNSRHSFWFIIFNFVYYLSFDFILCLSIYHWILICRQAIPHPTKARKETQPLTNDRWLHFIRRGGLYVRPFLCWTLRSNYSVFSETKRICGDLTSALGSQFSTNSQWNKLKTSCFGENWIVT